MRPLPYPQKSDGNFSQIVSIELPDTVETAPKTGMARQFKITLTGNGSIPFPQVIFRGAGIEYIVSGGQFVNEKGFTYTAVIPEGKLPQGAYQVQVEGCRRPDWQNSTGDDWVKTYKEMQIGT